MGSSGVATAIKLMAVAKFVSDGEDVVKFRATRQQR
jgi:hypothetical protein